MQTKTAQADIARHLIEEYRLPLIRLNGKIPVEQGWQNKPKGTVGVSDLCNIKGNLGISCGHALAEGEYLFAIDVDKHRNGFSSFKKLQDIVGTLPDTLKTRTGNGGGHIFFVAEEPLPLIVFDEESGLEGIEIRGKGAQVVAPGSLHENGKTYEVLSDPGYIEKAPDALVKFIHDQAEKRRNKKNLTIVSSDKIRTGRNDYLTRVAGQMRRSGLGQKTIEAALFAHDLERCDPPLQLDKKEKPPGVDQIKGIARSVAKYEPEEAFLPSLPVEKFEPKKKVSVYDERVDKELFKECFDKAEGVVGKLAKDIYASAPRGYYQFAIASALGIVSGVAQGSFNAPNLWHPEESRGNLSLYQVLIAPAAAGKDSYLRTVNRYLGEVDERLIANDFGSVNGMVSGFFAFNSRTSVIDEIQDYFNKLGAQKGSYLDQVLTKMKELYNNVPFIAPQQTKSSVFPKINTPKYSVFAVGTVQGYSDHIRGDVVGGGLQSRFIVWPHIEVESFRPTHNLEIDEEVIRRLRNILYLGKGAGFDFNYEAQLKAIAKSGAIKSKNAEDNAPLIHYPAVEPSQPVKMDDKAQSLLIAYTRRQEKRYLELSNKKDKSGSDMSPGSIIDRSSQIAVKIACLHALGRGDDTVRINDAEWAISIVDILCKFMVELIETNSYGDAKVARVLNALKKAKEPITMKKLNQSLRSIRPAHILHAIVIDLAYSDDITVINPYGEKLVVDEIALGKLKGKLPRGVKLLINNEVEDSTVERL